MLCERGPGPQGQRAPTYRLEVRSRRPGFGRTCAARYTGGRAGARNGAAVLSGRAGRQRATHGLQLLLDGHLLGEQCGLDAVEKPFEPTHELGLRDAPVSYTHLRAHETR